MFLLLLLFVLFLIRGSELEKWEWSQGSQGSCQECSCDRFLKRKVKNTTLPSHVKMTMNKIIFIFITFIHNIKNMSQEYTVKNNALLCPYTPSCPQWLPQKSLLLVSFANFSSLCKHKYLFLPVSPLSYTKSRTVSHKVLHGVFVFITIFWRLSVSGHQQCSQFFLQLHNIALCSMVYLWLIFTIVKTAIWIILDIHHNCRIKSQKWDCSVKS